MLNVTHPEVAARLLNPDPSTVVAGSGQTGTWSCPNHEATYQTRIYRVVAGAACPYCSRRKVLTGFNDLTVTHPEIAATVFEDDPTELLAGSDRIVLWSCPNHSEPYPMSVSQRVHGTKCGFCANVKVLPGFNDLATTHPALAAQVVESDPTQVMAGSNIVLQWHCPNHSQPFPMMARERVKGHGCGYCASKKVLPGFNDLASQRPDLAAELVDLDPTTVLAGATKKVTWRCKAGDHDYRSSVADRVEGRACPYCSGLRVLPGFNDLASQRPDLAELLITPDPKTVTVGSQKTGEWGCPNHHGSYRMRISHRTTTSGCPYCSGRRLLSGFNDLATTRPDLARELIDGPDPTTITRNARVTARWRCSSCGHEWKKSVFSRGYDRSGCPNCSRGAFDVDKPGYLYLMARAGEQQVGITNNLKERLLTHSRRGWELMDASNAMSGHRVAAIELHIRRWLRAQGWVLSGTLENWSTAHLEVTSLQELFHASKVDFAE